MTENNHPSRPDRPDLSGAAASSPKELTGKAAVVTGATAGIGFETARLLALHGATVLITGRGQQRGSDAVRAIRDAADHGEVDFVPVDHSSVAANENLAALIMSRFGHLDVLVNNVGGIFAKRQLTADGYELTLALNFLAPFTLTEALMPRLTTGPGIVRCVNVVSSSFKMTKGDPFNDLQAEHDYTGISAHARAKLLTLLWTMELSRTTPSGKLASTAVNPGMAWTPMTQSLTPETVPAWRHIFPIVRFFQRRADPARAASHCADLALAEPSSIAGRYFDRAKPKTLPRKFADPSLFDKAQALGAQLRSSAASLDRENQ
jgi:NAD(P)-dependent dehydrogenase (short-subunit alcohol dehydrogenase family)